jgi:hypothetical protein
MSKSDRMVAAAWAVGTIILLIAAWSSLYGFGWI